MAFDTSMAIRTTWKLYVKYSDFHIKMYIYRYINKFTNFKPRGIHNNTTTLIEVACFFLIEELFLIFFSTSKFEVYIRKITFQLKYGV